MTEMDGVKCYILRCHANRLFRVVKRNKINHIIFNVLIYGRLKSVTRKAFYVKTWYHSLVFKDWGNNLQLLLFKLAFREGH